MSKVEFFCSNSQEMTQLVKDHVNIFLKKYDSICGYEVIPSYRYRVTFVPEIKQGKKNVLGFCEYNPKNMCFNLAFSETLFTDSYTWDQLHQVIGHEVAHLINIRLNGEEFGNGHNFNFKVICKELEITNDEAFIKEVEKTSSVLNKVKKLLALSESDNSNESSSALLKAKKLMREYGIQDHKNQENEKIYRVELDTYKAYTTEKQVITHIVKIISNVWILLSSNSLNGKVIYAHGTKTECEIAEYLYSYLKVELAKQYKEAKIKYSFEGSSKPSFYNGVFVSMEKRFRVQEQEVQELSLVNYAEENKNLARKFIYKTTRFTNHRANGTRRNLKSALCGNETGSNLRIRNGLSNKSSGGTLKLN